MSRGWSLGDRIQLNLGRRYYEGGVSSVYFWNLDDGFAGVVLLKKGKDIPREYYLKAVLLRRHSGVTNGQKRRGLGFYSRL